MLSEHAPSVTRTAATRRGVVAVGFITCLAVVGTGAWLTASSFPLRAAFEACCLYALGLVVLLELRPAMVGLGRSARAARRRDIRSFRRQLDALPETAHPLGG
jgi:hypothetical protein